MIQKEVTVTNETGLHLRPASILTDVASKCTSEITLIKGNKRANAKSVLNIMAAQIGKGDTITVEVEGENEEEDIKKIIEAIEGGLGES